MKWIDKVGVNRADGSRYHRRIVAKEKSAQGCDKCQPRDERCIALLHGPLPVRSRSSGGGSSRSPRIYNPARSVYGSAILSQVPCMCAMLPWPETLGRGRSDCQSRAEDSRLTSEKFKKCCSGSRVRPELRSRISSNSNSMALRAIAATG